MGKKKRKIKNNSMNNLYRKKKKEFYSFKGKNIIKVKQITLLYCYF